MRNMTKRNIEWKIWKRIPLEDKKKKNLKREFFFFTLTVFKSLIFILFFTHRVFLFSYLYSQKNFFIMFRHSSFFSENKIIFH